MTMGEATRTCLRKYFQFSGRASRSEFWKFVLFLVLVQVALVILNSVLFGPSIVTEQVLNIAPDGTQTMQLVSGVQYDGGWFGGIFALATFIPSLAVSWRRMHDIGRRGLLLLMPWAGFLVVIIVTAAVSGMTRVFLDGLQQTGAVRVQVDGSAGTIMVVGILATLAAIFWLIVQLARQGDAAPNRYGPPSPTSRLGLAQ
jgi:uncharacterized membrane protein YhaH (DUF805 family)